VKKFNHALIMALLLTLALLPRAESAEVDPTYAARYWASIYNIDPQIMINLGMCESGMNPNKIGDYGLAIGVWQYHASTYDELRSILNADTTYIPGDRYESRDVWSVGGQAHVLAYSIRYGYAWNWSCWWELGYGG
jgi:hypothetical protein